MSTLSSVLPLPVEPKPRLRGVTHAVAFVAVLPLGVLLGLHASSSVARAAVIAFAASVAMMFGASGLYHRGNWSHAPRRWLRTIDHAGIYALIAGTYTAFGLLALDGAWRIVVLTIVWTGAACGIVLNVVWTGSPRWLSATLAVALGWIGIVVLPQSVDLVGVGGFTLLLAGGLAYTIGAVVFATRRPDPFPATFGYHEVFHVLVIAAVACHYTAVAFFLAS
jgi:hemolysin III